MANDTLPTPPRSNGTIDATTRGTPTAAPQHGENPVTTRRNGSPERMDGELSAGNTSHLGATGNAWLTLVRSPTPDPGTPLGSPPPAAYWGTPPVDPRSSGDGGTSLYRTALPPQVAVLQQAP